MNPASMIDEYLAGPTLLRQALAGMTDEQLNAVPVPGKWSSRQVLCHIADFELVYADRMKRVIAEDAPTFFGGDPDTFAAGLAYQTRDAQDELQLIESIQFTNYDSSAGDSARRPQESLYLGSPSEFARLRRGHP